MLFPKKRIQNRKIGEIETYKSYGDLISPKNKKNKFINFVITILCILLIGSFGKYFLEAARVLGGAITKTTVSVVSKQLGKKMIRDEFGNINIMFLGYGGEKHQGGYLADSIIVASRNPELGAITMISTPRDLVVYNKEESVFGRVNQIFSRALGRKLEYATGAKAMSDELTKITGITIPYYVLLDFQGFEDIINTLGGVDINVAKPLKDVTYPDRNRGIITFKVNSGMNHFSGDTALMYARSRHSTSDFDRSLRQQQIVKAVKDKLISQILSPSKIKQIYNDYTKIVKTNISLDEMIGLAQYADNINHMFSFGFTTECSMYAYKLSHPGCFLYTPNRDLFGGASVILPIGSDNINPNFYGYTQNFAYYVAHNQKYLIENANIVVRNGIDKTYTKQVGMKNDGYATQLAVKLKKYAFKIPNVENAPQITSGTIAYILSTGDMDGTIERLKTFLPIDQIINVSENEATTGNDLSEKLYQQQLSGTDVILDLGNTYLNYLQTKTFDYYR
ncbi:MAG: LCP family protein [Candidatus Absconditabacteria bacterium]